nr:hypothetical protein GCM10020093_100060 [Planobispora longispora]
MIALIRFKLAAYARSHRLLQPLTGLFIMMVIFYSTLVPRARNCPPTRTPRDC